MTDCILFSSYHALERDYGSHVTTWSPGHSSRRVNLLYTGEGEGYLQSHSMLNFFGISNNTKLVKMHLTATLLGFQGLLNYR